jgi:hypothetical protein
MAFVVVRWRDAKPGKNGMNDWMARLFIRVIEGNPIRSVHVLRPLQFALA